MVYRASTRCPYCVTQRRAHHWGLERSRRLAGGGRPEQREGVPRRAQAKERTRVPWVTYKMCHIHFLGLPSQARFLPSPVSRNLILQVPPGQWGMQVGQDLFLEKFKKFFRRREWGRWPLPASPFCFLSRLVYWKGGVFRPGLIFSWYVKKSTKPGIRNRIQILTPSPAKCVALGRLFSFPGLKLLKKKKKNWG